MPTSQTLKILKAFKTLKKNKADYCPEQYLKELKLLKYELNAQLSNPDISNSQMNQLIRLLAID